MQLALFTPGAYIWPVHRSFEAFIASLGAPASGASVVAANPLYPAREFTDSALHGMPAELDQRLMHLHSTIYSALLRPVEYFRRSQLSFVEYFAADLLGTPACDLLSAFTYYFVRRSAFELSVVDGLNVLRAVFFNHEASEPSLWLHNSLARLAAERVALDGLAFRMAAPSAAREHQLAFTLIADRERPVRGTAWICGDVRRHSDGQTYARLECGLDPSLADPAAREAASARIGQEVRQAVCQVFGWQMREAA